MFQKDDVFSPRQEICCVSNKGGDLRLARRKSWYFAIFLFSARTCVKSSVRARVTTACFSQMTFFLVFEGWRQVVTLLLWVCHFMEVKLLVLRYACVLVLLCKFLR